MQAGRTGRHRSTHCSSNSAQECTLLVIVWGDFPEKLHFPRCRQLEWLLNSASIHTPTSGRWRHFSSWCPLSRRWLCLRNRRDKKHLNVFHDAAEPNTTVAFFLECVNVSCVVSSCPSPRGGWFCTKSTTRLSNSFSECVASTEPVCHRISTRGTFERQVPVRYSFVRLTGT